MNTIFDVIFNDRNVKKRHGQQLSGGPIKCLFQPIYNFGGLDYTAPMIDGSESN